MHTKDYNYTATIINVVDGDTVDAIVDLGFTVSVKIRFRLYGIDTMEKNDKDLAKRELGVRAKDFLTDLVYNKTVMIKSHKTDKYGRWLAEIFYKEVNVNQVMLDEELAVPYNGGKK